MSIMDCMCTEREQPPCLLFHYGFGLNCSYIKECRSTVQDYDTLWLYVHFDPVEDRETYTKIKLDK